ncbi:MAG: hypothetical protein WC623_22455 [Pedobacter sp.]|uniref:hypothetical protein n=1 Tax=Pedobacter sp. TaxID=1411316 RepID=UPI003566D1DF
MIIYRNGVQMSSHDDTLSHHVDCSKSKVSPGTFQNKYGAFDDQKAQAEMFVKNLDKLFGINIDPKIVDVDYLGSCDVRIDGDYYVAIESKRRAR